jgi:nucleoid-associated protein YgaU
MSRRLYLVFAASLGLAACHPASKEEATYDDSRNPHYKQAQQDLDAGNPGGAAADYEAALAENPKLAEAHYELGVIYGEKLNDPVSSIYHLKRFLEIAPSSDKADQAKEQIDKQSQAFAASLPAASAPAASADSAKLEADNEALKKQVDDASHTIAKLQAQLASRHHGHLTAQAAPPMSAPQPPPTGGPMLADTTAPNAPAPAPPADGATTPAATPTNVAPAAPPRAVAVDTNAPDVNAVPPPGGTNEASTVPAGPSRTYTVVKGDSLWKIAHKMYPGDTKNGEDKIRDANKDAMAGKFLRPGQVLIIPQ